MKNGIKFNLNKNQMNLIKNFINSDFFKNKENDNYSPYWKVESKLLKFSFRGPNEISITGSSGFYIPSNKYKNLIKKLLNFDFFREKLIFKIKSTILSIFSTPKFMSHMKAFDAVMSNKLISDPDLSDYRFDHLKNSIKFKNIIQNYENIVEDYKEITSINLNSVENRNSIIVSYYYRNLLIPFLENKPKDIFLEIGAGSGNLALILAHLFSPKIYLIIDLPEALINSFIFISNEFPDFECILPDRFTPEVLNKENNKKNTTFIFLVPSQKNLIQDNILDLSINTHSFQEMDQNIISDYFKFIYRVGKDNSLFFCSNRVEKIPTNHNPYTEIQISPPNIFYDYPWQMHNEKLISEISKLHRLVCADAVAIKLEKIKKNNNNL